MDTSALIKELRDRANSLKSTAEALEKAAIALEVPTLDQNGSKSAISKTSEGSSDGTLNAMNEYIASGSLINSTKVYTSNVSIPNSSIPSSTISWSNQFATRQEIADYFKASFSTRGETRLEELAKAVSTLGPATRREIAEMTGIPIGTVVSTVTLPNGFGTSGDGKWFLSPSGKASALLAEKIGRKDDQSVLK